jgi:predicted DNA-binding transcriptional regulator AlpA
MQEVVPNPDMPQSVNTKSRPELEPAAVHAEEAAAMVGISVALWRRLYSAGRIGPRKIKLASKTVVWSVEEIRQWIRAGAPSRREWVQMNGDTK